MEQYSGEFFNMLTDLANSVWEVSQEWVDTILVPIAKKGNSTLLDIVGKLVARIVKDDCRPWLSWCCLSPSVGFGVVVDVWIWYFGATIE